MKRMKAVSTSPLLLLATSDIAVPGGREELPVVGGTREPAVPGGDIPVKWDGWVRGSSNSLDFWTSVSWVT